MFLLSLPRQGDSKSGATRSDIYAAAYTYVRLQKEREIPGRFKKRARAGLREERARKEKGNTKWQEGEATASKRDGDPTGEKQTLRNERRTRVPIRGLAS